jgi:hypothetical protein
MSSKILFVFVLVALVVVANCDSHCISSAFKARAIIADPKKAFDDTQHIYFDSTTNKQRIDARIMEPVKKNMSIFFRYDMGKAFEYDKQSGQCRSFPLTGSLKPFCLAQDAHKIRDITIGGNLKCEVWEESIQGLKMRLVIAPGGSLGVPVNIISRGGAHHAHVFQEWFDFEGYNTLPDQSVFDLPAPCQTVAHTISNGMMSYQNALFFLAHQ